MKHISVLFIDPFAREVKRVTIENDWDEFKKLMQCEWLEPVYLPELPNCSAPQCCMYIDENGLNTDWDHQAFFRLPITNSQTYAGRAIVCGVGGEEGCDDIDAPSYIDGLERMIRWIKPQDVVVPAPTMITPNNDGSVDVTLLTGATHMTYENQR